MNTSVKSNSENRYGKYTATIGLEVHVQLLTESKAYATEAYLYGKKPNSTTSPVTLGHPGTLPVANKGHFEMAAKMGLALNCTLHSHTWFARKNYFYPDLPKGYQVTQDKTPFCTDGMLLIDGINETEKKVGITRIHLEEDSGKSIHDIDPFYSLIDLNRAGVPLIEIVSEPDMQYPEEAYNYLTEIRRIVRHIEICDGNMEEGSLRCDANISVRKKGTNKLGTKVEVKNLNSMRNVARAIEYEIQRQIDTLEQGGKLTQDTRSFDAATGETATMRTKEMAEDYRYFPEPDLPPVILDHTFTEAIKEKMPRLPRALKVYFENEVGLKAYDAGLLAEDKEMASYFEALLPHAGNAQTVANWMNGPVRSWLNEHAEKIGAFPLKANQLGAIIELVEAGKVSHSLATQKLLPEMLKNPTLDPEETARSKNWIQVEDQDFLNECAEKALARYPDKVTAYQNGKKGLIGLFMGELMKVSGGKADPARAKKILEEKLEK